MSWAHVQTNGGFSSGAQNTLALAFVSNVAAGDILQVAVATGFARTVTVTDSQGNTYTLVGSISNGTVKTWVFRTIAGSSAANTVTAKLDGANTAFITMAGGEYAPPAGTLSAGTPATAQGSSTAPASGNVTVTPVALAYGAFGLSGAGGTATAGTGFTVRYSVDFAAGVHFGLIVEDRLNDVANPDNPAVSLTSSAGWVALGYVLSVAVTAVVVPIWHLIRSINASHQDTP